MVCKTIVLGIELAFVLSRIKWVLWSQLHFITVLWCWAGFVSDQVQMGIVITYMVKLNLSSSNCVFLINCRHSPGTNGDRNHSCGWAELWEVLHHTQCWIPHEMEGIVRATDHLNYFQKNLISRTNVSNYKMVAMPCIWDQMIPWYGHQTCISTTWKVSTSGTKVSTKYQSIRASTQYQSINIRYVRNVLSLLLFKDNNFSDFLHLSKI